MYARFRPSGDQTGCASPCASVANGSSWTLPAPADSSSARDIRKAASPAVAAAVVTTVATIRSGAHEPRERAAESSGTGGRDAVDPVMLLSANARSDADWNRSDGW